MKIMKKRGLGIAFENLLSQSSDLINEEASHLTCDNELRQLDIFSIQPGKYQPRSSMSAESLDELAESIKEQGIIQPIVVRPIDDNRYEIIAGERRWRAAQLAKLTKIPVLIKNVPDEAAIAMALIENIQRENLNPIEEAIALQRLMLEFAMTHQQVAIAVGRSRSGITNLLRLIELEQEVKKFVEQGQLSHGHAKVLLGVTGITQIQTARIIIEKDLSVRETERLIQKIQCTKELEVIESMNPDTQHWEEQIADKLGADICITYNKKGFGTLRIKFLTLKQLKDIISNLNRL